MAARWIEQLTGSFQDKRRYRQYKERKKQFPESYRTAIEALERYLLYRGLITNGDVLVTMLDDLADLFEQSVANGTPVRTIVGQDPVEFAEAFLRNYSEGEWISKERDRLINAIDRATADEGSP